MTTDLNQICQDALSVLEVERNAAISSRKDVEACVARRKEIHMLINEIRSVYYKLDRQQTALPTLPNTDLMDWAEDVLSLYNLAIVVIDTTSLSENADIIRFYAIDATGEPMIDLVVKPLREQDPNTAYTGISQEEIDQAPTLEEAWPIIQRALKGCFILYYNFEFLESRLKDNTKHYGLPRLSFRADDLMEQARSYFSIGRYGYKLAEACARIGYVLKMPAQAPDRAAAQLALLNAMANGVMSARPSPAKEITKDTVLGELVVDDHPF